VSELGNHRGPRAVVTSPETIQINPPFLAKSKDVS